MAKNFIVELTREKLDEDERLIAELVDEDVLGVFGADYVSALTEDERKAAIESLRERSLVLDVSMPKESLRIKDKATDEFLLCRFRRFQKAVKDLDFEKFCDSSVMSDVHALAETVRGTLVIYLDDERTYVSLDRFLKNPKYRDVEWYIGGVVMYHYVI